MKPHTIFLIGVALFAASLAVAAYRVVASPVAAMERDLAQQIEEAQKTDTRYYTRAELNYDALEQTIAARKDLWGAIVKPPPPAPPPPKPPVNVKAMLTGVKATRVGVGGKVKIVTPEAPRGAFFSIGEVIRGATITAITPTEVEFTVDDNGKPVKDTLPRER